MKSVLEKARSVFGSYITSSSERGERTTSGLVELHDVEQQSTVFDRGASDHGASLPKVAENITLEGDEVLFSKNNVLLKYHLKDIALENKEFAHTSNTQSTLTNSPLHCNESTPLKVSLDNHVLVPGFLFITTRGSNFGTTLILNWAPNSSMKVPRVDYAQAAAIETPSSNSATSGCDSSFQHKSLSQYASAISIDLCLMEVIRIFYHVDDKGFIVSGELVLKNKEEEFKVKCMLIGSGFDCG